MDTKGLYKVVVVEDEPKILRNVIQKIEKVNPAFTVIGSASNGSDAIPLINSVNPHVLFTDIKMPKMDGLELIKQIKNDHPDMQIIILSGYNEFEYAKQALRLGVRDYLLKPVEEDYLAEALISARSKLDAAAASLEREIILSSVNGTYYSRPLPFQIDDLHYMLLLICIDNLCNHLPTISLHMHYKELWSNISLEAVLIEVLEGNCRWWIADEKQPNQKFLILSTPKDSPIDIGALASKLLNKLCGKLHSHSVNICIDGLLLSLSETWNCAQRLRETLDQGLIMGKSTLITAETVKVRVVVSAPVDKPTLNRFNILLQSNNKNLLLQELASLFNKWDKDQYPQRILEKGLYQLIRQCYSQVSTISEVELNHLEYMLGEKFSTSRDILSIYTDVSCIFESMLVSESKDTENSEELANRIEAYIKAHFTEQIGLEEISSKFNFSISHITKLFKKYKHDTILKYLITLRINEAKRLMQSRPELELKNISEMTGYTDQHYFSRIFKNVTGVSPSEYKDSLPRGQISVADA